MPYIKKINRSKFNAYLDRIVNNVTEPGELTYVIYKLMSEVATKNGICYDSLSRAKASGQDAVDEYYRRAVAPYEDKKLEENGDI